MAFVARSLVSWIGLGLGFPLLGLDSEDSPIMKLEDVIGIEIQKTSLGERAILEGERNRLVIGDESESDFNLVRRFDSQYVDYISFQIRAAKGGWANSMMVIPNGLKSPPAVFVIDEECRHLEFAPNMPDSTDIDEWEGRSYSRMPLGSHLIGAGFAVGFPTPTTIGERKKPLSVDDWVALIKRFEQRARIDPESFFLVATHEHAELALKVAANMDFTGVVIEAPREMMFKQESEEWRRIEEEKVKKAGEKLDSEESQDDSVSMVDEAKKLFFESEAQLRYYVLYAQSIKEPKLIILAKDIPEYERTRKTLLTSLVTTKSDFSAVLLDGSARTLMTPEEKREAQRRSIFGDEDEYEYEEEPLSTRAISRRPPTTQMAYSYDEELLEQWIARMNSFLIGHSKTQPEYLPLPDLNQRGRSVFGGGSSGGNYFEDDGGDDPYAEEGGDVE